MCKSCIQIYYLSWEVAKIEKINVLIDKTNERNYSKKFNAFIYQEQISLLKRVFVKLCFYNVFLS